jgi:hypothetical protein
VQSPEHHRATGNEHRHPAREREREKEFNKFKRIRVQQVQEDKEVRGESEYLAPAVYT